MNLLSEYPCRVANPSAGSILILAWYTENEGQHLILARNRKSLDVVVDGVIKEFGSRLSFKGYWEGKFVSPSLEWKQAIAEAAYLHEFEEFRSHMEYTLRTTFSPEFRCEGIPDVKGISACTAAVEERWGHYNCKACFKGISIEGVNPEEVFLEMRETNVIYHPVFHPRDKAKKGKVSQAEEMDPLLPLWIATQDFGHHCKGLKFFRQENEERKYIAEGIARGEVNFLFQGVEHIVPEEYHARVSAILSSLKAERARAWAEVEAERSKERTEYRQYGEQVLNTLRTVKPKT